MFSPTLSIMQRENTDLHAEKQCVDIQYSTVQTKFISGSLAQSP